MQHYPGVGEKNEDICCQILNTGLLTAMREMYNKYKYDTNLKAKYYWCICRS